MSLRRLGVAAAVAAAVVAGTAGASPSPTFQELLDAGIPIYCGAGTKPYVALTFDDGPGPFAPQLVALLRQYHARATFFNIGRKAARKPRLVRLEASVGTIGDHSYTPPNLITLPPAQKAIRKVTKRKVILFRPPFGDNASEILQIARSLGMLEVMWNQDSGDASEASTPSSEQIYENLAAQVKAGGIVLMHEDEVVPRTLDALRMFLPVLEQEGLHAVTVPALLRLDPPPLDAVAKGSGGCNSSWHPVDG